MTHFSIEELCITQHKEIDNTPDEDVRKNLEQLIFKLETVRTILGRPMIITSGFRCLKLNRCVGSKDNSAHVKGLAADFICPSFGTAEEVFKELKKEPTFLYDQLILETLKGRSWIHLGITEPNKPMRKQALIIDSLGTHYA